MKIIIAPDSFKGNLTALEVANLIEKGIRRVYSKAKIVKVSMVDGGEGTVRSLVDATRGRIIRKDGKFKDIIEDKDATPEIRKIKEIHGGFLCAKIDNLFNLLKQLKPNNAQKEYYLTDVYKLYLKNNLKVRTTKIEPKQTLDVNTVEQLETIKRL